MNTKPYPATQRPGPTITEAEAALVKLCLQLVYQPLPDGVTANAQLKAATDAVREERFPSGSVDLDAVE